MTPLRFVILSLATFRIAHMMSSEAGPGDVFLKLRKRLGIVEAVDGSRWSENFWGKLVACPLCLSVWVAFVLSALHDRTALTDWLLVALAASGASSALELEVRK